MCMEVPLPDDAKFNLPGLALAYSTSSLTLLAGTLGLTTSTLGTRTARASGLKPSMRLYSRLLSQVWLMSLVTATLQRAIGRGSCRERVDKHGEIVVWVVA